MCAPLIYFLENRIKNLMDKTIPVITLIGSNEITVELGLTYVDLGATALDNYDGNITNKIVTNNNVNTNMVGEYSVTYNVTDAKGNIAEEITRKVIVKDTKGPSITIMGEAIMNLTVNDTYTEQGITVSDLSPNPTWKIVSGYVNTSVAGTYRILYEATDMYGNKSTAIRVVKVYEKLPIIYALMYNDTKSEVITSKWYQTYVKIVWETNSATIKLCINGGTKEDVSSGTLLKDGIYILEVTLGNKTETCSFGIDTKLPIIFGVKPLGKYVIGTEFTWTEGILTLSCDGINIDIDSSAMRYVLQKSGKYIVSITDEAGNNDEIFFTVI